MSGRARKHTVIFGCILSYDNVALRMNTLEQCENQREYLLIWRISVASAHSSID